MQPAALQPLKNAPLTVGAFFLALLLTACKPTEKETAAWPAPETDSLTAFSEESTPTKEPRPGSNERTPSAPVSQNKKTAPELRFLSYNLKNYLTMRRGKELRPKPEEEIAAVVALITEQKPDVLGLSEIGSKADLRDLQALLKAAGIDLPHSEHTGGRDKTRHLALLSRYPIITTNSQRNLSYQMNGEHWVISRGILDATIATENGRELRFLGVHLKSKREIRETDQELIRQNEARLLRNYLDEILTEDPNAHLLAYGDFNDTVRSKTLSIARGRRNSKKHMPDFYFKDSREELWTHFWDYQDTYSRIDYVLFSQNLRPHLMSKKSYIVDSGPWAKASDHRALMLVIQP